MAVKMRIMVNQNKLQIKFRKNEKAKSNNQVQYRNSSSQASER